MYQAEGVDLENCDFTAIFPQELDEQVVQDLLGNGICQDIFNIPECGYDHGDCCLANPLCGGLDCFACLCHVTEESYCNCDGQESYSYKLLEGHIGSGQCNGALNHPGCWYDGGDCCRQEVDCFDCDFCFCRDTLEWSDCIPDGDFKYLIDKLKLASPSRSILLQLIFFELYLDCCDALVVSLDEEINKEVLEIYTEEDMQYVKEFEGYFVRVDNPGTRLEYRDRYYDQRVITYWYPPLYDTVHPTKHLIV